MIRTVGELIEELSKYPSERPVKISAQNGGLQFVIVAVDGDDPAAVWVEA